MCPTGHTLNVSRLRSTGKDLPNVHAIHDADAGRSAARGGRPAHHRAAVRAGRTDLDLDLDPGGRVTPALRPGGPDSIGLGRIFALHRRSSTSYQIH